MANIHELVEEACKSNELSMLQGVKYDAQMLLSLDKNHCTPLMVAAKNGNTIVLKFLDDKADELLGYDVYKIFNIRDIEGYTALSLAAKHNHTSAVVTLYELGAYDSFSANQTDWLAFARMNINSSEDRRDIANTLKTDARHRLTSIDNKQLYNLVIDGKSTQNDIRAAVRAVGNVNEIIYDEEPALYHAVLHGTVSAVKVLLEEGARITPEMLPLALDSKNEEIISLIGAHIPLKTDPNDWGYLLDILFEHAIKFNNAQIVNHLLPKMTQSKLQEAFLYSAELGSDDVLRALLSHGVNVNSLEKNHRTRSALMLAAKNGYLTTVKILLSHHADIHLRSEHGIGLTALDYAKIYRRKNCASLLLNAAAFEKYGDSPLVQAAAKGSANDVFVLAKNADNIKTAITVAKITKQPKAFIKELRTYLKQKYPNVQLIPILGYFKKRAKK